MAPFDRPHTSFYSSSIVTMALSCTVFEIKQNIGRETLIFQYPIPFNLHDHPKPIRFFSKMLTLTVRVPRLLDGAKILPKSSSLCVGCHNVTDDRQTDRRHGRLMP